MLSQTPPYLPFWSGSGVKRVDEANLSAGKRRWTIRDRARYWPCLFMPSCLDAMSRYQLVIEAT